MEAVAEKGQAGGTLPRVSARAKPAARKPPPLEGLTPLDHVPLHERVYRQLRRTLILGQLQPGQKLSVRGVATTLQVSPMPVRAALARLHAERGLTLGRYGTVSVPRLSPDTVTELMELRVMLEGLAAERAAERMTEPDLRQFETVAKRLMEAISGTDVIRYLEANAEFKLFIYTCAQSPVLLTTIESLWLQVGPTLRWCGVDAHFQCQRDILLTAIAALRDRRPSMARAAIEQDIRDGLAFLLATMA